jgi:diguanylate cyclase (GGDEF)-like protein
VRQSLGAIASRPSFRVWLLTGTLLVAAMLLFATFLRTQPGPTGLVIPWPVLALAFAVVELKVVDVHFKRETHSFSLSELPAVVGFFFVAPGDYLLAVLAGTSAALLLGSQQRLIKTAFNLANYLFVATVSLTIVNAFADVNAPAGVPTWIAAFAATSTAAVVSAVSIALVITLSGGAPQFEKLPEMIRFGVMVSLANTSLALLGVAILRFSPVHLWLLVLPLVIVFVAYQAYLSEREKHERLELLYESSRILQHSPELDSALIALLDHAREMFRAEVAEIVLYPRDETGNALRVSSRQDRPPETMVPVGDLAEDAMYRQVRTASGAFFFQPPGEHRVHQGMASPLRGETDLIGSFYVANRLTEGTSFRADDLPLLETLANQVAVALENGHLEQSLSELSTLKEQLRYQAYHDPLTGLPNRSLFLERVTERAASSRPGHRPAVLFLDLDDFKVVNDTLGHRAGDVLLVEVADRIRGVLRSEDVAARLGGDEFAILLDDGPDLKVALSVATRLVEAMRVAFIIDDNELQIGASVGVASGRLGTETAEELLRNADVAMYTAKAAGKNQNAVFEPTMHGAIVARHELSAELSRSLGRGELLLLYQPIVDLQTGLATGAEALVRWRHPSRGLVGPDEFIPIAEETGIIVALGTWVVREACREAAAWIAAGASPNLSITVNLAAQQLQEVGFVDGLAAVLAETGLAPERLVLEMTETVMFRDAATTISRLERLRALGVRIAIDDFGTGYSSLGYLRRFPVDIIKIAREFIGHTEDAEDWTFAAAIVAIGRALNKVIVAEGIENDAQRAHLRDLGCDLGQGFLFARPLGPAEARAFLELPAGEGRPAVAGAVRMEAGRPSLLQRADLGRVDAG